MGRFENPCQTICPPPFGDSWTKRPLTTIRISFSLTVISCASLFSIDLNCSSVWWWEQVRSLNKPFCQQRCSPKGQKTEMASHDGCAVKYSTGVWLSWNSTMAGPCSLMSSNFFPNVVSIRCLSCLFKISLKKTHVGWETHIIALNEALGLIPSFAITKWWFILQIILQMILTENCFHLPCAFFWWRITSHIQVTQSFHNEAFALGGSEKPVPLRGVEKHVHVVIIPLHCSGRMTNCFWWWSASMEWKISTMLEIIKHCTDLELPGHYILL